MEQNQMNSRQRKHKCRLNNFYPGEENQKVYTVITNLAADPDGKNVFLLGKPSSGKSHLLVGIEKHIKAHSTAMVERLSCNEFKNLFVMAITNGTTAEFYDHFIKNTNVLLLDDCQFLTESIVDVLVQISTEYIESGKTLILAGDYLLAGVCAIPNLQVLHLTRAGQATRKIILQERLREKGIVLEDTLLNQISEKIEDPRRITGFATFLAARRNCS